MVKSLSVMGITDSDFPMSSIIGRANLLLTTSIGGGVHVGIKIAITCWFLRGILVGTRGFEPPTPDTR
ncbi:hypothetical protein FNH73_24600 [Salmonella enterica subsp. salamae]|nr:hypothetical protein [Salmonella enterica subsp. salamae]ECJ2265705.1 hypothetical protein [Salmonella enterica subsp. salamae]